MKWSFKEYMEDLGIFFEKEDVNEKNKESLIKFSKQLMKGPTLTLGAPTKSILKKNHSFIDSSVEEPKHNLKNKRIIKTNLNMSNKIMNISELNIEIGDIQNKLYEQYNINKNILYYC